MIQPRLSSSQLIGCDASYLVDMKSGFRLHPLAVPAWQAMAAKAAKDGIELQPVSTYRSYPQQAHIWQQKCTGARPVYDQQQRLVDVLHLSGWQKLEAILLFSALPGCSRHHWGTELDVFDAASARVNHYQPTLDPTEYQPGGVFALAGEWLRTEATRFDFFLPYQHYRGGVAAEPWHLSYRPLAEQCLADFQLVDLESTIRQHPIAEQNAVLQHLPVIYQRYCLTLCQPPEPIGTNHA